MSASCEVPITNPKNARYGEICGRAMPCKNHAIHPGEMPAAPLAELFEDEIDRLDSRDLTGTVILNSNNTGGGIGLLGAQLAASGSWTPDSAARIVYAIVHGQRFKIGLNTADQILAALGMTELWHTHPAFVDAAARELAAAPPDEPLGDEPDVCASCGHTVEWRRGDAGVRDHLDVYCSICWAESHRGLPLGPWKRDELLDLYRRYVQQGLTLAELAVDWRTKGYRDKRAAVASITSAWIRNGWPMRRRGESKRLRRARTGATLLRTRKLDETEARALHPLHWDGWQSINELAKANHERLGLTQSALCSQLSYTWKLLDLPRHDRIEMCVRKSTVHGMKRRKGNSAAYKRFQAGRKGEQYDAPCEATTVRGKPCAHRAMLGSTFCQSHDPARRTAIEGKLAEMRSRSPLSNPDRVEPLAPLQAEMRSYFEWAGGWAALADATGVPASRLSSLSGTKQQRQIAKDKAAVIRSAMAALTAPALARAA